MDDDVILSEIVKRCVPLITVFGFYVIINGHLSPGGGFAGGAVIGIAMVVFSLVFGLRRTFALVPSDVLILATSLGPLWYAAVGLTGIFRGSSFLANSQAGISIGEPFALASGGLIPLITIGVGVSVAVTVTVLFVTLVEGD
jgi:multicomponent Na+:H+ antiporter subunit B